MKFDGVNWINVGNAGFSGGTAEDITLVFNSSGEPLVSFVDFGNSKRATLMKFNGTDWVYVGPAGFSAGDADYPSLALSPTGAAYLGFVDGGNGYRATVMKYDSVAVGISDKQISPVTIYPNPATDQITVEVSLTGAGNIIIETVAGKELIKTPLAAPLTSIDIRNLPIGVYFVRLTFDKTVQVQKFIKQ